MKKLLAFAILMLTACGLYAQVANNTQLVGTVTDASGAVIPNAKVVGTNVDTKVQYPATTNAEGFYTIPLIPPGTYDVTVEQSGFSKQTNKGVIVTINLSVRSDFALRVGDSGTEVTVSASNPPLSTDDALLGETIDAGRVHDLPTSGRQVLQLAQTTSNIVVSGTALTGVPPGNRASGSGTRNVNNSITLDGVSIINNLTSTASLTPNPDATASLQTQNGNYTAQYGDYIGVHIDMSSRAGTNAFHGTVYDYIQNDVLNSRPFATPLSQPKNKVRYNQFGGVLSGPIVKDKAFFMGSYEGIRQNNTTLSQGQVMTARMKQGDFGELLLNGGLGQNIQLVNPYTARPAVAGMPAYLGDPIPNNNLAAAGLVSPVAARLMQYFDKNPNVPGSLTNNAAYNVLNNLNLDDTLDRVDYNPTEKIRLFGRFAWQRMNSVGGSIYTSNNTYSPTSLRNGVVGYTHFLTPNMVNDFRAGFNTVSTNFYNYFFQNNIQGAGSALGIPGFTADVSSNNPGLPTITFPSGSYQGTGGEDGTNWFQDDRTLTLYDQFSYTHNKHSFMAGVSIRRLSIGRAAQNGPRGTFSFTNVYSGDAAADLMLGAAASDITPFFQVKGEIYQFRDGFFAQDTWQVTPKFTLQYGVRYELPQVAKSLNGVGRKLNSTETAIFPAVGGSNAANAQAFPGFAFSDPNHTNIAPRLGFSYRVTDKTVIRGGGGIYYNANHLNSYTLSSTNYPYSASVTYSSPAKGAGAPTVTLTNPTPGTANVTPVAGTPGTYVSAFTENPHLPPATQYQWNVDLGQEVWRNGGFELQYLGSHTIHLDESLYSNQPNPDGNLTASVNSRRPNQLFGQIRRIQNDGISTYNGLTAILRQRMTHGLTANLSYTWAHALDTSDSSNDGGSAMWQGHIKLDYGNSNQDIRNRFVGTVTYELPKLQGHNYLLQETLGGWQVNAIIDIRSGTPFNISTSGDRLNVGNPGGAQRPDWAHSGSVNCTKANVVAKTSCVDITAYNLNPTTRYGNLHRNDLLGPNQLSQDNLSLFKSFRLYHDVAFQFRAEAFNFLNHANLGTPNGTLPTITTTTNGVTTTSINYAAPGTFGTVTASGSRTFQLAGKINF